MTITEHSPTKTNPRKDLQVYQLKDLQTAPSEGYILSMNDHEILQSLVSRLVWAISDSKNVPRKQLLFYTDKIKEHLRKKCRLRIVYAHSQWECVWDLELERLIKNYASEKRAALADPTT